jgi:hypothetical protein
VFKTCTKQFVALSCGLIGFLTFAFIFTSVTLAADQSAHKPMPDITKPTPTPTLMLTPTPTLMLTPIPTLTPTPTPTPTLTLSQPGNDNQPIGHPGTTVDITAQGFPPKSSVSLYTAINPNQCVTGGALMPFSSQLIENVQADGTFNLQTTWPSNASQPGTAYYVCAIPSGQQGIASGQTFSVAPNVTVNTSTSMVNPGDSITITGDNWLPPHQLQVSITPKQATGNTNPTASTTTTPDNNGHFSVNLTIDNNTQPGQYEVDVVAPDESTLTNQPSTTIITVNGQATPTATPIAPSTGGTKSSGGLTALIFTLGGLGLLCIIIGGVIFAVSGSSSRASSSRIQ